MQYLGLWGELGTFCGTTEEKMRNEERGGGERTNIIYHTGWSPKPRLK